MAQLASEVEQGSDEWLAMRGGKLTASRMAQALAKTKSGWGASRENLKAQLIVERLSDHPPESYINTAMQWGLDTEPLARSAYEFSEDVAVVQVAFVDHPRVSMSGCSPDGLVGDSGLIEIKCPNTMTHIQSILGSKVDKKYNLQVQWQMACTGRLWCDFVSFDPRLSLGMQMHIIRIFRDQLLIEQLEADAVTFLNEVAELEARLKVVSANSKGGR